LPYLFPGSPKSLRLKGASKNNPHLRQSLLFGNASFRMDHSPQKHLFYDQLLVGNHPRPATDLFLDLS
jgi:hypothetical protein